MKNSAEPKVVKVQKQSGAKAAKIRSSIKAGGCRECGSPPPKLPVHG